MAVIRSRRASSRRRCRRPASRLPMFAACFDGREASESNISVIVALLVKVRSVLAQNSARQEQLQNLPAILGEFRGLAHRQRPWPGQLDVNNTVDATGSWRHDDDAVGQEHGFGD